VTKTHRITALAIAGLLLLAGCSKSTETTAVPSKTSSSPKAGPTTDGPRPTKSSESPVASESPVPVESNPPGDIPDNTQFVSYQSKGGGFTISVPEGWARATTKASVSFTDKLNTIAVSWAPAATAPTTASATSTEVPQLKKTERAFKLVGVSSTTFPAGKTVLIGFQENSAPNSVTGKQYRDDVLRYELFNNGQEVVLTLTSPVGSDNIDPWRIVTQSLKWA
jgi:hypothetical protein